MGRLAGNARGWGSESPVSGGTRSGKEGGVSIADLENKAREIQDLATANPENLRDSVAELAGLVHDLAGKLRAILAQCGKEQAQWD
jgi:hypothetical protein